MTKNHLSTGRLFVASILASLVGIELGACAVTLETELSGVTALPLRSFLMLMTGIHLAIGIGEGLATGAIIAFVVKSRPDLLFNANNGVVTSGRNLRKILIGFGVATLVLGGGLAFFASEYPDGLEWSIERITGSTELEPSEKDAASVSAAKIQDTTSVLPDYDNSLSGIIGAAMVVILVGSITSLLTSSRRRASRRSQRA